jgi:hypothetical protein
MTWMTLRTSSGDCGSSAARELDRPQYRTRSDASGDRLSGRRPRAPGADVSAGTSASALQHEDHVVK